MKQEQHNISDRMWRKTFESRSDFEDSLFRDSPNKLMFKKYMTPFRVKVLKLFHVRGLSALNASSQNYGSPYSEL